MLDYETGRILWTRLLEKTLRRIERRFRGDEGNEGHLVISCEQEVPPLPRGLVMTSLPLLARKREDLAVKESSEDRNDPDGVPESTGYSSDGPVDTEPRTRRSTITYVLETGRCVQFLLCPERFYLDLPNTTLVEHEPAIIFAQRQGFYRDDPNSADRISSPEDIRDFEPIDKCYTWDEIPQAAEDAAWLLFDLYNLDVNDPLQAQLTDEEDHRWVMALTAT